MISIFFRPTYLGNRYFPHADKNDYVLQRVSSQVRGVEIGEYLGAKLNPTEGYENDVKIHVKPVSLDRIKDGDWLDFLDGAAELDQLKYRPKINLIAASQSSYDYLTQELENRVVLIPQHHINTDNERNDSKKLVTAGYIGAPSRDAERIYKEVWEELKKLDVNFITCYHFKTRQDSINFYKSIDVLVIADFSPDWNPHKIPTKIINAASFGVPTIAYPLQGYQEIEGNYIRIKKIPELISAVKNLKHEPFYKHWSDKVFKMAEPYHISKIAELYKAL